MVVSPTACMPSGHRHGAHCCMVLTTDVDPHICTGGSQQCCSVHVGTQSPLLAISSPVSAFFSPRRPGSALNVRVSPPAYGWPRGCVVSASCTAWNSMHPSSLALRHCNQHAPGPCTNTSVNLCRHCHNHVAYHHGQH